MVGRQVPQAPPIYNNFAQQYMNQMQLQSQNKRFGETIPTAQYWNLIQ